jgi:D-serine deaminase-like pyridoxal phosphate-dependent protein
VTATMTGLDRRIVSESADLDTPVLVVDETILRQNIAEMAETAQALQVNLRPHMKTHKTHEIARMQIEAGAVGITCAKLSEAEAMAVGGIEDIVIGFAVVGDQKYPRLLTLMERVKLTVAVDSFEAAERIARVMAAEGRELPLYLEINTGHDRNGVLAGEDAVELATRIERLSGVRIVGIMTHEGQANQQPPELIEPVAIAAGEVMVDTAERLRAAGIPIEVVSVGSTPAAKYTATVEGVTEIRPGTYVFRDTMGFRYGIYGPDRCAARILTTVSNRPVANRAILDAGSKTLAADKSAGFPGHGYIVGHPELIIARLSEEHGVVEIDHPIEGIQIGDRVEVIPNHICPCVNLHDSMTIVRDGVPVDEWKVAARGAIR